MITVQFRHTDYELEIMGDTAVEVIETLKLWDSEATGCDRPNIGHFIHTCGAIPDATEQKKGGHFTEYMGACQYCNNYDQISNVCLAGAVGKWECREFVR